mgnify:CR=1 FL=1
MRWKYRRLLATFQSTLPARGATKSRKEHGMAQEFQSTLPARGATRWFGRSPKQNSISIHAPRTGSDVFVLSQLRRLRIFQSTLPARGATKTSAKDERLGNFNPRSPHGERLPARLNGGKQAGISIHAPRTGSDVVVKVPICRAAEFQSTLPARGATRAKL